jgi:putative redox protein
MASTTSPNPPAAQAVVGGGVDTGNVLTGRTGAVGFLVGGPSELGGSASGPNPYDLLSASLAACTAMTIRLQARHRKYPLSHVEVAVSYHHSDGGGHGSFERAITLEGALNDDQRAQLLRGANTCPVGRTLGLSAEIHTHSGDEAQSAAASRPANYVEDLEAFSIVNIDPD